MTYSTMLTAAKELCGIGSSVTAYDTFLKRQLNFGQNDFNSEVNFEFAETTASGSSSTYKFKYALTTDVDVIKSVRWENDELKPMTHQQYAVLNQNVSVGDPRYWMVYSGSLVLYPYPKKTSSETLLSGALTTTAVTLALDELTGFENHGRIKIESEIIEYSYADSDCNLYNLIRGLEDSTASAHADDSLVTFRNIEYDYYKVLPDMSNDGDISLLSSRYHRALPIYASAQFFYKLGDPESLNQAESFMKQYLIIKEQAKRDLNEKQTQEFTSVLDDTIAEFPFPDNTRPDDSSLTNS